MARFPNADRADFVFRMNVARSISMMGFSYSLVGSKLTEHADAKSRLTLTLSPPAATARQRGESDGERARGEGRAALVLNALIMAVTLGGPVAATEPEDPSKTYYVQLVRGTDQNDPPQPGAKAIGPKLAKRLQPVFRWKNYWEINRVQTTVEVGKKTKVRLSRRHEVEIDLSTAGKRTIHFYEDGKRLSTSTQPIGESITIQGGQAAAESAWFIVVRRDKPTD